MQCCSEPKVQPGWFGKYYACMMLEHKSCGAPSEQLTDLMKSNGVLPKAIREDLFEGSPVATSDPKAAQQLTQLRATKRTRGIAVVVPFVLKQAACVIRMVER